jgi:tetratricopeptide (TPR) repeat protein
MEPELDAPETALLRPALGSAKKNKPGVRGALGVLAAKINPHPPRPLAGLGSKWSKAMGFTRRYKSRWVSGLGAIATGFVLLASRGAAFAQSESERHEGAAAPAQSESEHHEGAAASAKPSTSVAAPADLRARALYDQALQEYNSGRYENSLSLLRQAYALSPGAGFLFNIAQCERKLGRCTQARTAYQEYITQEADPARRSRADRAIESLKDCDPKSPEVQATPAGPRASPVAGGRARKPFPRAPARVVRVPNRGTASTAQSGSQAGLQIAKWSLFASGGVAALAAGYFALSARSASSDVSDAREWNGTLSRREEQGRDAATLSRIFVGSGIVLIGAGLSIHFLTRSDRPTAIGTLQVNRVGETCSASWVRRF